MVRDSGIPALTTFVTALDAWHIANNVDPLEDSDTEADEHVRNDYGKEACHVKC